MLANSLTATVVVFFVTAARAVSSRANLVNLGYTQYQGSFDSGANITSFLGIRYAAPPTGPLRWRPPQPPAATSGTQQANIEPKECFQGSLGSARTSPYSAHTKRDLVQDEDCLFLNVFVSGNISPNSQMPVVVWIHGGGYVSLSAAGNGGDLVNDGNGGVISVIIQYRLGIFGFLPGSEVKANGVVNAGLLDQRFALQWVQDNISKFGGDPSKVTIWGESAGAGSVLQHVVANGGNTAPALFRAAMTSSTYLPPQYYYNDTIPEEMYTDVVEMSNCADSQDTMTCLRGIDAITLDNVNHVMGENAFRRTSVFVPVIDGELIIERPLETLRKGTVNGNALLAVTNTFEGRVFVSPSTSNITDFISNLFPNFGQKQVEAAVAQYTNVPELPTALDQAIAVMGEGIFICPSYYLLEAFGDRGFKGQFAISPANHGDDLGQYFPSTHGPLTQNVDFIKSFSQSFLAVVKSLDPNVKFDDADITPNWSSWNTGSNEMLFNVTDAGDAAITAVTTDPGLRMRCDFWQRMAPFTPQ